MKRATLDALVAGRDAGRPMALVTRLADGAQWLVAPGDADGAPPEIAAAARAALAADESRSLEIGGETLFIQVHTPPWRMAIVGAVHIAQALAPMAAAADYRVLVVDPRGAFASAARFPGVELSRDWPDEAFDKAGLDAHCAVVALTHDPKIDDPALTAALQSEAFYIGALGSRRTHARRLERLADSGADRAAAAARIHGPIGLAIGARAPAEIAVAILAQVVAARRLGAGAVKAAA